jgi:hypothetical protein
MRRLYSGIEPLALIDDAAVPGRNGRGGGAAARVSPPLLDRELASADPVGAWLDRYLTPPSDYVPPTA